MFEDSCHGQVAIDHQKTTTCFSEEVKRSKTNGLVMHSDLYGLPDLFFELYVLYFSYCSVRFVILN